MKENPEKSKLYAIYTQFLEAEIARCDALYAAKEGNAAKAHANTEKAKSILFSFVKETDSPYYLKIRAEESLSALKKSKVT